MAGKEKRKYINYKVDAYFRERFSVQRSRRAREWCTGETCLRALKFARFFIGCSASLCNAVAPWVLSFAEALSVLLLHFLGIRPSKLLHNLDPRDSIHRFKFRLSVDDIVTLVMVRAMLLSVAYFVAAMRMYHRLYLYITYTVCAFVVAYVSAKLILLDYRHMKHKAPSIAICIMADVASFVHILAARKTVEWVKRRYQTGLMGISSGFDELEEPWNSLGYGLVEDPHKSSSDGGMDFEQDVAVDMIAEADSRFVEVSGMRVHYKEVAAALASEEGRVGIVLLHGFGAGTFAWRHIMEPIAMQCQCRVVAFDRPGFGLTSRPKATSDFNPYEMNAQASLVLAFCERLGLEQVVLVGHADGCLLATLAASKACMANSGAPLLHEVNGRRDTHPSPVIPEPCTNSSGAHHGRNPSHTELSVILDSAIGSTASGSRSAEASANTSNPQAAQQLHPVGNRSGSKRGSTSDISSQDVNAIVLEVAPEPSLVLQPNSSSSYWGKEPKEVEVRNGPCAPEVLALGFLHPVMSGAAAPTFARLLARSKLGRSILRPLLRTEIGEVANRRAWYNTDKLTGEVLELYKAPLRVEGWDMALIETTRLKMDLKPNVLAQHFAAFMSRSLLVLTGEQDRVIPPSKAEALAAELPSSQLTIIPNCGHLSHEETPAVLLETLVPFCGKVLDSIKR